MCEPITATTAAAAAAGSIGGGITTTAALSSALAGTTSLGTIGASSLAAGFAIPTWVSPAMTILGGGLQAGSMIGQGNALRAAGEADRIAANNQAALMEQNAGQERATAQRAAVEERRRAGLVSSRARAVSAASGTTGKGITDILGDIEQEGEYRYLTALAAGESAAQGMEYGAAVRRAGGIDAAGAGRAQQDALRMRAASTLAGSVGSTLFQKYG